MNLFTKAFFFFVFASLYTALSAQFPSFKKSLQSDGLDLAVVKAPFGLGVQVGEDSWEVASPPCLANHCKLYIRDQVLADQSS